MLQLLANVSVWFQQKWKHKVNCTLKSWLSTMVDALRHL